MRPNNTMNSSTTNFNADYMDFERDRYPFCIVWTPIPLLTWICPIIGHMGIATSSGVIRDFAGPYVVSEDNMAFGRPTKYWKMNANAARGGPAGRAQPNLKFSEQGKVFLRLGFRRTGSFGDIQEQNA